MRSGLDAGWAFDVLRSVSPDTAMLWCASWLDDKAKYKPLICRRLECERVAPPDRAVCDRNARRAYYDYCVTIAPELEYPQ